MSNGRRSLVRISLAIALVGLAIPVASADPTPADTGGIARCAAIAAADSRLACYDALAVSVLRGVQAAPVGQLAPGAAQAAAASQAAAAGQTAPATGQGASAAQVGAVAQMAPAAQAAAAAQATASSGTTDFGLSKRQLKVIPEGPDSIQAEVSQITQDRLNNVYVVLDNGQTWAFVEPEPRIRPGNAVKIKRASLGSFLMTTPSRHGYRVRRVQ
jgi:hypothetical protein